MSPFAVGSVSVNLYTYDDFDAVRRAVAVGEDAKLLEALGFDGVTVSEHHGGLSGYFPCPVLVASWLLEETEKLWVAPMPVLLSLRPDALVIEEIAWLAARHPGRVGLGAAPGYSHTDFELLECRFEDRVPRFAHALRRIGMGLRSGASPEPLTSDPAVALAKSRTMPIVSAAGSRSAVRRAAESGVGLVFGSHTTPDEARAFVSYYRELGGNGPVVLGRRVWVGRRSKRAALRQFEMYQRIGRGSTSWSAEVQEQQVISGDTSAVVHGLLEAAALSDATALSLRIHWPGCTQADFQDQVSALAEKVIPHVRHAFVQT